MGRDGCADGSVLDLDGVVGFGFLVNLLHFLALGRSVRSEWMAAEKNYTEPISAGYAARYAGMNSGELSMNLA